MLDSLFFICPFLLKIIVELYKLFSEYFVKQRDKGVSQRCRPVPE